VNILEYVRHCFPSPQLSGKTQDQFGVLAFDLGEVGPNPRPPPIQVQRTVQDKDHPSAAVSPSGPWAVQVRNWSSALKLQTTPEGTYKLDKPKRGKEPDYLIASYGSRSKICSERWLLGGLTGYLKRYHDAYGRLPLSVSLYSFMMPCAACNGYMRGFPGALHTPLDGKEGATIPKWYLAYTADYTMSDPDKARSDRKPTDRYSSVAEGDGRTAELWAFHWHVMKG
jgi:hypothetical protein